MVKYCEARSVPSDSAAGGFPSGKRFLALADRKGRVSVSPRSRSRYTDSDPHRKEKIMRREYIPMPKPVLALVFLLATGGAWGQDSSSLAKERKVEIGGKQYLLTSRLKAVLLGIFTYQFDHVQGKAILDSTLSRIGRTEGWTVDRVANANDVTAAKLANYQVFFGDYISNWTSPSFPVAGRVALQEFVESKGRGLFLMHSSGDATATAWDWFRTYVQPSHYNGEAYRNGASSGKVGVFKGYQNNPSAVGHPILQGIGWGGKDSTTWSNNELHSFDKPILDPAITPAHWQGLLSLNAATCGTPNNCGNGGYNYSSMGGNWPVAWTFPLKKGNIGYFMEGHDLTTLNSMTQAVWDRFFRQFLYYIAGYDTTAVTAVAHPGAGAGGAQAAYAVDASGITFHPGAQPGVLITKAGAHIVGLYDLSGKKIREVRGAASPIDYGFASELAGKSGIYVLRVRASGAVRSRMYAF
jgi:hypothetical protein